SGQESVRGIAMDDMYRDYILDHYKNPRNSGDLPGATNTYHDTNPLCGDEITMALLIEDDKVKDVRFKGRGCAISQASASILTEEIKGKSLDEVKAIDRQHVLENLGIPPLPEASHADMGRGPLGDRLRRDLLLPAA